MAKSIGLFILVFLTSLNTNPFAQSDTTIDFLTPDEITWLNEHKNTLRFAPNPSWMPADYINNKGVHKGFVADYIKIIEEKLNIKLQIIYFDSWAELLEGIKNNQVDLIGAVQKTDERAQFMNFTDVYQTIPLVILTRNNHPSSFNDNQINRMKLSGVKGYASIYWAKQKYPGVTIIESNNDLTAILKTSLGETDGTITDFLSASYIVEKYGINNMRMGRTSDYSWNLRMASSLDKPELCSIINKTLNTISEDEKRFIYTKWVNLNNLELPNFYLMHHRLIVFGTYSLLFIAIIFVVFFFLLKHQVRLKTRDLEKSNTEIIEAKKQIQASEKHFRQMIENLSEILCKVDEHGNMIYVSPSFCKLFGKDENELLGKKYYPLIYEDDLQFTIETLETLNQPPHKVRFEHRLITPNGLRWFEWTSSPLFNEQNQLISIIGTGRDVTDNKKYEIELKKALKEAEHNEALKTAFLENMSHEIRTPLNSILGFIELVKDADLDSKSRDQFLVQVEKNSNELLSIISNIVDLSKIETGQAVVNASSVNIHTLFNRLFNDALSRIPNNKDVQLSLSSKNVSPTLTINTDEVKLHQILCNIMHNAIKFTNVGYIKLSYNINSNNRLEIIIEDTGVGIPEIDRERIFKRFTQGTKSKGALQPGLGIGLSIAKAYAELLNGTISFESKVGKGTSFKVNIPVS